MIRRTQVGQVMHPHALGSVYLSFLETPRGTLTVRGSSHFRHRAELRGRIVPSERVRLLRPSVVTQIVRPTSEQLLTLSRAHTYYYHLRLRAVVAENVRVVWDATGNLPPGFATTERTPSLLLGSGRVVLELPDFRRVMWVGERPFLEVFSDTDVGYTPAPQLSGVPEAPVGKADLAVFASAPDDILPLVSKATHLDPRFSKELPLFYLRTTGELPEVDAEFETLAARAARLPRSVEPPIPVHEAHPKLRKALDFFSQRKPSG